MNKRAHRISKAGNINRLQIVETDLEAPAPNEVQVDVKAIGLNFADIFAMYGLYSATPKGSFVPGLEYAGVVIQVGDDVESVKRGDRVMGVTKFGGYTSAINIDHRYITNLPDDWSFQEGAAYLVQALTAYYALVNLGGLKQGDTVLIHSAAGGVGLLANRIAKKLGAFTIGTVGNERKIPLLKSEGYDRWIVRGGYFSQKLNEALHGRDLNIILECIGGKIFKIGYELMARQGRMVVYGSARYGQTGARPNYLKLIAKYLTRAKIDPQKMIEENKAILGFNLIWLYDKADLMREILIELETLNLPAPYVGHQFQFEEMKQAIQLFQTGQTTGKVIVNV
ncbi:MAG: zinc-binding dehydrogenase [Bacteroidota bacterium]